MMRAAIAVMTRNPGEGLREVLERVNQQSLRFQRKIVVDSNSTDSACVHAAEQGFEVFSLGRRPFNHGGTREWCVKQLGDVEIVVFLTQDAILASGDSVERLLAYFADAKVGAAYGRQLPHEGASKIAAHARLFNYGEEPRLKTYADRSVLGIKTPFLSDSFAAYRLAALEEIGGFDPESLLQMEKLLTRTEFSVAQLVAQGYTNVEIGRILNYSPAYVKKVVSRIFTRLDIGKRNEVKRFFLVNDSKN